MAKLVYRGKAIIPAPFITFKKEYLSATEGERVGSNYQVSINGQLVAHKGSPNNVGVFWDQSDYPPDTPLTNDDDMLDAIINKQKALMDLFSVDGGVLEVITENLGVVQFLLNPRVLSINFEAGSPTSWNNKCLYSITLECDHLQNEELFDVDDTSARYIKSYSENWSIDQKYDNVPENSGNYYIITHDMQAQGIRHYEQDGSIAREAWERARDYVRNQFDHIDGNIVTESMMSGLAQTTALITQRNESINKPAGTYSFNEIFTSCPADKRYTDQYAVNTNIGSQGYTASINGVINGLGDSAQSKNDNCLAGWRTTEPNIYSRTSSNATLFSSGLVAGALNPLPVNRTISKDITNGVINYNYEYDTRPSSIVPGSLSESINVTFDDQGDQFAEIFVIGRKNGPILQDLGTKTVSKFSVEVDILMPKGSGMPDVNGIINSFKPYGTPSLPLSGVFNNPPQRTWSPYTGQFRHVASWTYWN